MQCALQKVSRNAPPAPPPTLSTPKRVTTQRRFAMNFNLTNTPLEPILALLIGILILFVPRFLNYFVAGYLILVGILGLTR